LPSLFHCAPFEEIIDAIHNAHFYGFHVKDPICHQFFEGVYTNHENSPSLQRTVIQSSMLELVYNWLNKKLWPPPPIKKPSKEKAFLFLAIKHHL